MKDPIDSRQLHIFLVLATRGSLRAAGAELFLTTSAISHSIRTLEENLGTKLFHRPGKFLELTDKGQFLLKEGAAILSAMERVRDMLNSDDAISRAPVRIAVGFNFLTYFLPEIIREWQQCFPQGKILARAAERDACLKMLDDQEVDAAILIDPPADSEFKVEPLFDDELHIVLAAGSPLARSETVSLRSLHGKTLLVSRVQSHTTKMVLNEMKHQGCQFHNCLEVGGGQAIHELVKAGQGVAFLPDWVVTRLGDVGGIVLRPPANTRITRRWAFVSLAKKQSNVMERTLLRLCRTLSENLGTPVV